MTPQAPIIKSIRIVSPRGTANARIAQIRWANSADSDDASLYIKPYGQAGWTIHGHSSAALPPGERVTLISQRQHPYRRHGDAQLSLHHSGQSHVYVGPHGTSTASRLTPVAGAPLDDPAGGHIATISWATLDELPAPDVALKASGPNIDLIAPTAADATRTSFQLYTGTDPDLMRQRHQLGERFLQVECAGMAAALYVGFRLTAQRGTRTDSPGVTVLGGWGPGAQQTSSIPGVALWLAPDAAASPPPAGPTNQDAAHIQ
ncbi:hypothetical protein [Streptomyces sp. NPDC056056]|uniref:hypothetical protein n=1 Tax=Streptomyces sp. NPDC056056 TaxID=3345698 RepID=UPI0035D8A936